MAVQTGSTYISESMADIIKIQTANLWFSVSLGDGNNHRQPEMAAKARNTYISETTTDNIKIPTANLGFTTMWRSEV